MVFRYRAAALRAANACSALFATRSMFAATSGMDDETGPNTVPSCCIWGAGSASPTFPSMALSLRVRSGIVVPGRPDGALLLPVGPRADARGALIGLVKGPRRTHTNYWCGAHAPVPAAAGRSILIAQTYLPGVGIECVLVARSFRGAGFLVIDLPVVREHSDFGSAPAAVQYVWRSCARLWLCCGGGSEVASVWVQAEIYILIRISNYDINRYAIDIRWRRHLHLHSIHTPQMQYYILYIIYYGTLCRMGGLRKAVSRKENSS